MAHKLSHTQNHTVKLILLESTESLYNTHTAKTHTVKHETSL